MRVDDIRLEVRDKTLKRVGVILPQDYDFEIADLHNNVGAYTLTIAADHPLAETLLTPGSGIILTMGGVTFSGPVNQPEYSANQENSAGKLTIKGISDSVLVADALAFPQPSNSNPATQTVAFDEATGTAEGLLHWYVDRNIGPSGSTARKNRNLTMGPNLQRGSTFAKKPRFDVLGDLLNEIASVDGMGYRIVQREDKLVFETYATEDRRLMVRLSLFNNELESQTVATSAPGVTRAIVGGLGEQMVSRKFIEVTTTDSLTAEAEWGRRIERFVDQKQTNLNAELLKAGQELLADQGFSLASVQTVPVEDSSYVIGVDYGLGDVVAIEVNDVELATIVTGYVLKVNMDGVKLGLVCGNPEDFSTDGGVVGQLSTVARRVGTLELTAASSEETAALSNRVTAVEARVTAVEGRTPWRGRYSSTIVPQQHSPNDGNLRTIFIQEGIPYPSGATGVYLTISYTSSADLNAAGTAYLLVKNQNGSWSQIGAYTTHNNAQPNTDMGTTFSFLLPASESRIASNGTLSVAINMSTDAGSGSYQYMGRANLSLSFIQL